MLEKPSFGLEHPDYQMTQFACDSLHEWGIALLLSRDRKHKPARVRIISTPYSATPKGERSIVSYAMNIAMNVDINTTVSVILGFSL